MPSVRLVFSLPQSLYEPALARCLLSGMQGSEEEAIGGRITLTAYFADHAAAQAAASELRKTRDLSITAIEPVGDEDWLAKWRESMKPARLANGFWVSPTWLPPPSPARHWIRIEPKMAFGTGHHETTRLAAAAIIANRRRLDSRRILDIGTGSGVLCFTADACCAASCLGIEIDAQCRDNLAENRTGNPARGRIAFVIGSIGALSVRARFDCIVMNMLITESAPLLGAAASLLSPGGLLIWSGILRGEAGEAIGLARNSGFTLHKERRENEWWCGTFTKSRVWRVSAPA